MSSLFCILLPSIIGVRLIMSLDKSLKWKELFIYYLLLIFFSNCICMGIVILLNNFDGNLIVYISEHLKFALKYTLLLIPVNLLLSFIFIIFIKYVKLTLDVERKKTNVKNTKKNN